MTNVSMTNDQWGDEHAEYAPFTDEELGAIAEETLLYLNDPQEDRKGDSGS
jgi:hypothetical protein